MCPPCLYFVVLLLPLFASSKTPLCPSILAPNNSPSPLYLFLPRHTTCPGLNGQWPTCGLRLTSSSKPIYFSRDPLRCQWHLCHYADAGLFRDVIFPVLNAIIFASFVTIRCVKKSFGMRMDCNTSLIAQLTAFMDVHVTV